MKVLLANPRGFCAGVNMAIECLDDAIRRVGTGIYVYHEIVHNKYVVDRFTSQGVKFVNSLDEVPIGGILLFSAHGVSPEIRSIARERKLQTVDATCPLVTKVHLEAIRYANQGFNILLIGHDGRGAGEHHAGSNARRSWQSAVLKHRQAGLSDSDDAERGRSNGRH